ncbi:MFS transporter [Solimonas terrae]|uniref:MFS transporter n=1 Tax=Solimonas terrae TaxID=1396819 RepID=A0A6M2BTY6_9GAMM|nr:MFS transporter [Solimonas terrae]NGY05844.1 MFS transporter [Solimonas terrae]
MPASITTGKDTVPAARSSLPALLLLGSAIACSAATQGVFGPLQEAAKLDLGLSDFQISLVQGLAASLPVAVLSIPLGRMTDRGKRVRLLAAMAVCWTLGTLMTAFAQGFAMLFAARTLAAVGMMCALPVAISIAADLSVPERRGRSLLLLSVARMVGVALSFALGGSLLGRIAAQPPALIAALAPWRGVHLIFGIASALLAIPLLWLREPARHELEGIVSPSFREAMHAIWQRRALLAPLFLGQVTVVMADASAGIWASPVLIRDYGLQPADFGAWMGLIVLLSGLVGSIIGGVLAELGQKGRIPGGLLGGAVLASLLTIPAAFFPVMPTVGGFAAMLTVLVLGGAVAGLITATALAVLLPNELRGVCLGAFVVVGAVFGFGVAPTVVTLVSDLFGGEAHIRDGLTVVTLVTSVVASIGFLVATRAGRKPENG